MEQVTPFTMSEEAKAAKLYVIHSDQGDGGWSIHSRTMEDEDGIAPVLKSGTGGEPTIYDVQAALYEFHKLPNTLR